MKFAGFREYRPSNQTIEEIIKYLSVDLVRSQRELTVGLTKLDLEENFNSFLVNGIVVPAASELAIRNQLNVIPTQRIIVKGGTDSNNVVDGDTPWDINFLYLKNVGATDATINVLFIK